MPDDGTDTGVSRRRLIELTGAATLTALAGCSGDGDSPTTAGGGDGSDGGGGDGSGGGGGDGSDGGSGSGGSTDRGGGNLVRSEMKVRQRPVRPPDGHANPWNPSNWIRQFYPTLYDRVLFRGRNVLPDARQGHMPDSDVIDGKEGFVPQIATDWTLPDKIEPGSTVTITLRNDPPHTWHNGDPVTAQDYYDAAVFNKHIGTPEWEFLSDVQIADDYTIEYTLDTSIRKRFVYWSVLYGVEYMTTKHSMFRQHVEALEDATTDDEVSSALSDLQNRRIEYQDAVGCGPWTIEEAGSQEILMSRYDDYQAPANLDKFEDDDRVLMNVDGNIPNFPDMRFVHFLFEREQQMFRNLNVDAGRPSQMVNFKAWPDALQHRKLFRNDGGGTAIFNFDHPIIGRTKVRHAIAHIINREAVLDAFFPPNIPNEKELKVVPSGMSVEKTQFWLDDLYDQFNTYNIGENVDQHHQRATELLEEEGFTKDGEFWLKPDGERWQPEFTTPTFWNKWQEPNVNQMRAFGVDAQLNVEEPGTYFGQTLSNNEHEIGAHVFRFNAPLGIYPHPWFLYRYSLKEQSRDDPTITMTNMPAELEVPGTPGDMESSMTTVNVVDLVDELAGQDLSSEREREIVQTLAWTFNYQIPGLAALNFVPAVAYNSRDFDVPPEGSHPFNVIDGYINSLPYGSVMSKTE